MWQSLSRVPQARSLAVATGLLAGVAAEATRSEPLPRPVHLAPSRAQGMGHSLGVAAAHTRLARSPRRGRVAHSPVRVTGHSQERPEEAGIRSVGSRKPMHMALFLAGVTGHSSGAFLGSRRSRLSCRQLAGSAFRSISSTRSAKVSFKPMTSCCCSWGPSPQACCTEG